MKNQETKNKTATRNQIEYQARTRKRVTLVCPICHEVYNKKQEVIKCSFSHYDKRLP